MAAIVLATLNARHAHASLGLRYLQANLGELEADAKILEFVIGTPAEAIAEEILEQHPRVLGLGVYIWNVEESTRLVAILKRVAPELIVVLGGPEVSFANDAPRICALADAVVSGPGEIVFAKLCRELLAPSASGGDSVGRDGVLPGPAPRFISAPWPDLATLAAPYRLYDDHDLAHRHVYVEASRGCPYRCEFCLSALDRTAVPFPLEPFLAELARLHDRGARAFKFIDRTFNLRVDSCRAILEFFLERIGRSPDDPVYLHFELIPDHLPTALRTLIQRFPAGTLQFEIGIQSWDPEVTRTIGRRQDNAQAESNLAWLRQETTAHLHVDLIIGLPGENLASFAAGFDRLRALDPHEIQVGILKRLRGAPIDRHTQQFAMRYNPNAPYDLLANRDITFAQMRQMARFARYWDLIGNSGRFTATLPHLLGSAPFDNFMAFARWLYGDTRATHGLGPERLLAEIRRWFARPDWPPGREDDPPALGNETAAARRAAALAALDQDLERFQRIALERRGQNRAARLRQARNLLAEPPGGRIS